MRKYEDLLDEDAFVAAPNEPHFWNILPSEGYKLVEPEYIIKGDELRPFFPRELKNIDIEFKAIPLTRNITSKDNKLLLPLGHYLKARDPFKQEKGETLFSVFGGLDSEEKILQFASKHGSLKEEKTTINLVKDEIPLVPIKEWKDEIEKIKNVLEIYDAYEAKKDLNRYIKHFDSDNRSNRPKFVHPGFTEVVLTVPGKGIELSSWTEPTEEFDQPDYRVLVLRGIAQLVNETLRGQLSLEYFVGKDIYEANSDDQVRSFVTLQNLKSAIWLSFAWGFFKDGSKNRQWERCYISGKYFLRKYLSKEQNDESFFYLKAEYDKKRNREKYQHKKMQKNNKK